MTGEALFTLLMSRLGDRSEPALRTVCVLEAQLAQQNILEGGAFLPWFLISEDTTAELTVNERRLEVPSDFIRELDDEGGLSVIDEAGNEHVLEKKGWDELISWHGAAAVADVPENYALVGKYFMIFPLPRLGLTVRMRYYARQTVVNDDAVETNWTKYAADLLLAHTGYHVATKHLSWPEKGAEFQAEISAALGRIITDTTARLEGNRARSMG